MDKKSGIAKILIEEAPAASEQEPDHAGMGIVVDPFHVITCAHVVNVALNRDPTQQDWPTGRVNISFPMLANPTAIEATVARWRAPGQRPQDDIAVLQLEGEAPAEAGVAALAEVTGMPTDGDELSIFGIAEGQRLGNHIDARFKDKSSAAWVQMDGVNDGGAFIEGGFSGAAVWDFQHSVVLGMMIAKKVSEQQRVAYMISTADLREFWPDLPVEQRPLSHKFGLIWTVFSATYFLLLLAHLAVNRGISTFSILTLSGNQKQLASFWGMHLYAFLAPILLLMLVVFAKSFRLHDWTMRVPAFGEFRSGPPRSASTLRTAAISLAAFIVLPFIAQVHFIRMFHNEGYVYVYPSSFGYQSDDLIFANEKCYRDTIHLCTKREAGRYSLAIPKLGTTAQYWNNAYQFGDRDGPNGSSVTFFPILQPILIMTLTTLSAGLSAFVLFLVFRRSPERSLRGKS